MKTFRICLVLAGLLARTPGCGSGDDDTGTGAGGSGGGAAGDDVPAVPTPPGGLAVTDVPQFVAIGFDDNGYSGLPDSGGDGGVQWVLDTLAARQNPDGTPLRASFYMATYYIDGSQSEDAALVKQAWRAVVDAGHEIGSHTHSHPGAAVQVNFSAAQWTAEIQQSLDWLTKPWDAANAGSTDVGLGLAAEDIRGFRTPELGYNDALFGVLSDLGFAYDCTIEEGYQTTDGGAYNWPYTLDNGSPGNEILVDWGLQDPITPHPGLWEMPDYPVFVPPDEVCAQYGVEPGFRDRMHAVWSWFEVASGQITGFDWNLWLDFGMTKAEFLATLKYNLDLRLAGNHAPFLLGMHSDIYSSKYETSDPAENAMPNSTEVERREAVEEFLDYALSKLEVRVVSTNAVREWMRNPTAS